MTGPARLQVAAAAAAGRGPRGAIPGLARAPVAALLGQSLHSGVRGGSGPRPPAPRPARRRAVGLLPRCRGASLGKGTAAFPRSGGPQPPRPGRCPSAGPPPRGGRCRSREMLWTPCQRGGPKKLNPFSAREAILQSQSGWFLISGLAVKAARCGRGKTYICPADRLPLNRAEVGFFHSWLVRIK